MRKHHLLMIAALTTAASMLQAQQAQPAISGNQIYLWNSEFNALNRRIYARTDDDAEARKKYVSTQEDIPPVEARLREIIREAAVMVLASPRPTAEEIVKSIKDIQGEFVFGGGDSEYTNTPFVDLFRLGRTEHAIAAYVTLAGGDAIPESKSSVDFYVRRGGEWKLSATAASEFQGCTLFLSALRSLGPAEQWYLAWGKTIGDTGSRLKVRLYGFDGNVVRTIWKRDELTFGQLQVSLAGITLNYQVGYPDGDRIQEVFAVTPDGLTQISKSQK